MADGSLERQRSRSEVVRIVTQITSQRAFLLTAAESLSTARSHVLPHPLPPLFPGLYC